MSSMPLISLEKLREIPVFSKASTIRSRAYKIRGYIAGTAKEKKKTIGTGVLQSVGEVFNSTAHLTIRT